MMKPVKYDGAVTDIEFRQFSSNDSASKSQVAFRYGVGGVQLHVKDPILNKKVPIAYDSRGMSSSDSPDRTLNVSRFKGGPVLNINDSIPQTDVKQK